MINNTVRVSFTVNVVNCNVTENLVSEFELLDIALYYVKVYSIRLRYTVDLYGQNCVH